MRETRILFIDDHMLFRESVVRLLSREPDMQVVAQCGSLAEALRILDEHAVDLVLLDYDLGFEFGTSIVASVLRRDPAPKVMMVTGGMQTNATLAAVRAGISGLVLKHSEPDRLLQAIREVNAGGTWWDSGVLRLLSVQSGQTDSQGPTRAITDRQRRVLQLILDGLSNKEIAAKTQCSESAVKACIQELFAKTGVRTRSQLVRIAVENYASDWLKTDV